jgi:hypothetical protein
MKPCICCNEIKPLSDYYTHKGMVDGHLNKCKKCIRGYTNTRREHLKETDPVWAEKEAQRHRDKANAVKTRYPEKYLARKKVRSIKLEPSDVVIHRHHWSYQEEHHLDIIPLTQPQHLLIHTETIYDPERLQYRRRDNLALLYSKEVYLEYMNYIFDINNKHVNKESTCHTK